MKLKQPDIELVRQVFQNKTEEEISFYNIREQIVQLDETEGIKGFKNYRYHVAKSPQLDADKNSLVMSVFCLLLKSNKHVVSVKGYDDRHIHYIDTKGRELVCETDTINSLQTDLNIFIKDVICKRYNEKMHHIYTRGAGIKNKQVVEKEFSKNNVCETIINREKWLYEYIDEIFYSNTIADGDKKYDQQKYLLLNEWAKLIHTFGNIMIGPKGFNASKTPPRAKSTYNDRLDLFLKAVKTNDSYKINVAGISWQEHLSLLMVTNYLEMYFVGNEFTTWGELEPVDLREGNKKEWIEKVIDLIKLRRNVIGKEIKRLVESL